MDPKGHRVGRALLQTEEHVISPSWNGGVGPSSSTAHQPVGPQGCGSRRTKDSVVTLPPLIHSNHHGTSPGHSAPRNVNRTTAVGCSTAPRPNHLSPTANCISLISLARGNEMPSRSPVSVIRRRSHGLNGKDRKDIKHQRGGGGRRAVALPMPVISLASAFPANANTLIKPESISGGIGSPPNLTAQPSNNTVLMSTLPRQRNRKIPSQSESGRHSPEPREASTEHAPFRKIVLRKGQRCSSNKVLRHSNSISNTNSISPLRSEDSHSKSNTRASHSISSPTLSVEEFSSGPVHGQHPPLSLPPSNRITSLPPSGTRRNVRSADTANKAPASLSANPYSSTLPVLSVGATNVPVTSPPSTPNTPRGSLDGVVVVRQPTAIRSMATGIEGRQSARGGELLRSTSPHPSLPATSRPAHCASMDTPLTVLAPPFAATAPLMGRGRGSPERQRQSSPSPLHSGDLAGTSIASPTTTESTPSHSPSPDLSSPSRAAAIERLMGGAMCAAATVAGSAGCSYASRHRLPGVFEKMLEDMLREKPRSIQAWMQKWFEDYNAATSSVP